LDDRITPANVAPQANFGNLVSALNNVAVQIDHFNALNNIDIGQVQVVNVQNVLNGNNVRALNNALNHNSVDVGILQNFLNNSANNNNISVLDKALQNANVLNNNVVALDVLSGGQILLFTV